MLNPITLLEKLGQDARLRYVSSAKLEAALTAAEVDPSLRSALLAGTPRRLEALLGTTANVCCAIFAPQENEKLDG